jgi:hypothetical protein
MAEETFDRRQLHRLVGELRNGSVCGMHAVTVDMVLNAASVIERLQAANQGLINELSEASLLMKAKIDAEALESRAELEAIARADLRDDFAKAAIAGLVVVNSALTVPFTLSAQEAYEVADAMLAAREKGGA